MSLRYVCSPHKYLQVTGFHPNEPRHRKCIYINHSFPLLLKWGCRLGKSGMTDVENLGFKLIPRAQMCPELPLTNTINVDTPRSCPTLSRGSPVDFRWHSNASQRCMFHKQGSRESCSLRVPRAHPAAERTCAGNRDHPTGKSSKRSSLPILLII